MKQFVILIIAVTALLFSTIHLSFGQNAKITWSPEFLKDNGDNMGNVLYDDGTNVYMFVFNKSKGKKSVTPGIMKLDASMKPVQRKDFKASAADPDDIFLMDVFYCGGKFIMLSYKYNKQSNVKTVFATSIDLKTLEPSAESTQLWKVSGIPKKDIYLSYELSNDTNLFVVNAFMEQKDSEMKTFAFKTFDASLNTMSEKKVDLKYESEKFIIFDYLIANDNTVYYFAKSYLGNPKKESKKSESRTKEANYEISVLRYDKDGSDKEIRFQIEDKLVDNISAIEDPAKSDIVMFMSNIVDGLITEYEIMRISAADGSVVSKKQITFSKKLVDQIKLQEPAFKSNREGTALIKTFNISESKLMPDGRMYLVFGNDFSQVVSSSKSSYTNYYSRGMIVCLHDADGTLKWMNYIPKNQWYRNITGFQYPTISYLDDKVCVYYNDLVKNLNYDFKTAKNPPAKFNSVKEMNLMSVEITNEGKLTRKKVLSVDKSGIPVLTIKCLQGEGNRMILYCEEYGAKRTKIGILDQK